MIPINPFVLFAAGMLTCFLGGGMLKSAVHKRSLPLAVVAAFIIGLGWRANSDSAGPVLEAVKAWLQ